MRTFLLPCLAPIALWGACGSDPEPTATQPTSTSPTGGPVDTAGPGPTTPPVDCLAGWADGVTAPDPDGPDTQIHATSIFDGERLWVAWNRPDGGSQFDIWVAAFGCDGAPVVDPVEVTATDDSELDPVLAVSGDRLLVAWSSDNGTAPSNLDIRYRVLGLDGVPLGGVQELAASRDGVAVTGNATQPDAVGVDGGFLLAGAWGHDGSPAFQGFVVSLDLDGTVVGEASDAELDPVYGQTQISVVDGNGTPWLAWQEDSVDSVAPTLVGGPLGSPATVASPGARPDLAWSADGAWVAFDTDAGGEVVVQGPDGSRVTLGSASFVHSPSIVAHDDGAVVLAMELVSGVSNRLRLWSLGRDLAVRSQRTLSTDSAVSVYGVDLTLIDAAHAVVVYQDGVNPAFRAKAEWVTLSD